MTSGRMAAGVESTAEHPSAAALRAHLLQCLGGDLPRPCELEPKVGREEQRDGYSLLWVDYAVEPGDRVPAILLIPDGTTPASPAPGVAVWHLNFGENDALSPIREVRHGMKRIAAAYERADAAGRFTYFIEAGAGHVLSEKMWRRVRETFRNYLS